MAIDRLICPNPRLAAALGTLEARLLNFKHDVDYLMGVPADVCEDIRVLLHWDAEQRRTVPCWQDDACPYCYSPSREVWYIPLWLWWSEAESWIRRVGCLPGGAYSLLLAARPQTPTWKIKCQGTRDAAWTFQGVTVGHSPPEFRPYSVCTLLKRLWGKMTPPRFPGF